MSGDDYLQQQGQDQLDRLHEQTALEDQPLWPPTFFPTDRTESASPHLAGLLLGNAPAPVPVDRSTLHGTGAPVPTTTFKERT